MNEKNNSKLEQVKNYLNNNGIFFTEHANGQLKADKVNLWVTTEKWFDEKTNEKGLGINTFINHLKRKEVV